jgi:hypothetical protein
LLGQLLGKRRRAYDGDAGDGSGDAPAAALSEGSLER